MELPIIIIENCEPITEWVLLEYKHASKIAMGNIIFTNINDRRLEQFGKIYPGSFVDLVKPEETVILDPSADTPLRTEDFDKYRYFVVGGICGDYPPKGRTKELISSRLPQAERRNLGKKQLSVDGAVLMIMLVYSGEKIENIEVADSVEIKYGDGESTILPFGYIILNNKAIITPGLIELLMKRREESKNVF